MNRSQLSDREIADRFIEVFYNQNRLVDAFREWVHPDYVQHDPNSATGRDGTIEALEAHMKRNPRMTHDVKRVIHGQDGMVAVHYHFRREPEDRGLAVVDLFKIENGYLVEHWDVMQPVPDPATCKNSNGMF
jgi:predicted SnoaL-like aldol condensation-catalyzing enzyme